MQADAAFSDFLPYAGPRALCGFTMHYLVHNAGCHCAWKWVISGEQRAAELLGRLLEETSIAENPALGTSANEARFILLEVVHDNGSDTLAPLTVAEVRRLLATHPTRRRPSLHIHTLSCLQRRRRRQAVARHCHYRRRGHSLQGGSSKTTPDTPSATYTPGDASDQAR
ncbi:hypothetical protein [Streptomyces mirabilis]|uniref:hypothetical protein n=1 Tax=Streptomyces mirabilis TaxID=68239 RepID=UPI0036B801D2